MGQNQDAFHVLRKGENMKKISGRLFLCIMILLFSWSRSDAAGFGLYGSFGSGSADFTDEYILPKFSTDSQHEAIGITFDSNLASDRIFNYHLEIGRDAFTSKNFIARNETGTPSIESDLDLAGLVMSNTFGFGGQLSDTVRMWMGPEIRLHWVRGAPSQAPNFDLIGVGIGFGPSLGLNINLPSGLTIMLKGGYIISHYSLDGEGYINTAYSSNSYDVDERFAYLNLEFLFRTRRER